MVGPHHWWLAIVCAEIICPFRLCYQVTFAGTPIQRALSANTAIVQVLGLQPLVSWLGTGWLAGWLGGWLWLAGWLIEILELLAHGW